MSDDAIMVLPTYIAIVPRGLEEITSNAITTFLRSHQCSIHPILPTFDHDEKETFKHQFLEQLRRRRQRHNTHDPPNEQEPIFAGTLNDGSEINVGYHGTQTILSNPGLVEGVTMLQFTTDAPPRKVCQIRGLGCGPLLSPILTSSSPILNEKQSLREAIETLESFISHPEYLKNFKRALETWAHFANDVWFNDSPWSRIMVTDPENECRLLRQKIEGKIPLAFRASCVRSHSKKYTYKRELLLPTLGNLIPLRHLEGKPLLPHIEPTSTVIDSSFSSSSSSWNVNLKNYDFELVGLLLQNHVTFALSLQPHQHLNARSFSNGKIPADVTPPFVTGKIEQLISLRPSTAALLLHIANPQPGDIVLDPCAGIGTIPVEAALSGRHLVGIGGDIVARQLSDIISNYSAQARDYQNRHRIVGAFDFLQFDAMLPPLRDGCVDIVVSDLPFGQKCMSLQKLNMFLPLLVAEMGRLLRPRMGKAVLLCRSFQLLVDLFRRWNGVFVVPCCSIFPVNIGGLTAWIVVVRRGKGEVKSCSSLVKNRCEKVKKMMRMRKRMEHFENMASQDDGGKKRKARWVQA